eukprot:NODE_150_length_17275_cov_0.559618.p16 type:complete len:103 gc:universal NODE_150_length_17275_cov_0.559618:6724-6416(-)
MNRMVAVFSTGQILNNCIKNPFFAAYNDIKLMILRANLKLFRSLFDLSISVNHLNQSIVGIKLKILLFQIFIYLLISGFSIFVNVWLILLFTRQLATSSGSV